jgi:CheY-like chemotaxis protein
MPLNTILVEDSKTIQDTLVPALAELADARVIAIVSTAAGAKQAMDQWEGQWQLMVVDLFLSEGSGLEVLQALRQREAPRLANQHVYVLTNYATDDMRRRCKALGADGVYDKSTELEAFFERCISLRR